MIPDRFPDMITFAGHSIWYDHPELITIDLVDIKEASKNICRYGGHRQWHLIRHHALCGLLAVEYSWAKKPSEIRGPLIHDFPEVYVNDVISGLKKYLPEYKAIEDPIYNYVFRHFGLDPEDTDLKDFIHLIDRRALIIEMTHLGHPGIKRFDAIDQRINIKEQQLINSVAAASLDDCWNIIENLLKMTEVKNG